MKTNLSKFNDELDQLLEKGKLLLYSMALDVGAIDEETRQALLKMKLPSFKCDYESWYSISMQVIKQVLPDRYEDFVKQYKNEKRKEVDHLTYTISDYLIGLRTTRGYEVKTDGKAAIPKFESQLNILKSAKGRLSSALYDMVEVLQADFFDNEIEAARELWKKGFYRGAGAVGGVVLERHLGNVCEKHGIKVSKKHPTINDFNQLLKDKEVIDVATWRFIQHLGDLRNLCDHSKEREPKKEEIDDLLSGVSKVCKTIY